MDIAKLIPGMRAILSFSSTAPIIRHVYSDRLGKEIGNEQDFRSGLNNEPGIYIAAGKNEEQTLKKFRDVQSETGFERGLIFIEGIGLLGAGNSWDEAEHFINQYLRGTTVTFIEKESKNVRVPNKVVIVTGGAQGFGKGIVEELVFEGAYIMIADVNDTLGKTTVDEINRKKGKNHAVFYKTDVTDPESVKSMIDATVREFGGIDVLISNAGVLKAGSLEEMDENTFDFVTGVNYKGYFICTKYVVPVMKLQHEHNPSLHMDIIQINSKSGLTGSNKNFAYAGAKFGAIGLTQSFALELIPFGIKVNAICPGNYFEGPLWSDPETGLFAQYLKAGKVQGARNIEDVKKAYESKVPMNRGCTPRDVVKAIYYLIEQEYETGQALPVTGGQVMLS
jgi:NAD(P)-dependent dehydrogenase (short-subunit alcohol dehydrogenase family)